MSSIENKYVMNLNDLLNGYITDDKFNDININDLNLDSRQIQNDNLFIAVNGDKVNGIKFINHAIEQGAAAVLWQSDEGVDAIKINWRKTSSNIEVPIIALENLSQLVGEFADRFYQHPSKNMTVCGITGTNGKTSCADFIAQMMSVNTTCGLIGTLGSGIYPDLAETGFTTPDAITCHKWLAEFNSKKVMFSVMEVSSHALTQGRVNNIQFDSAVFTNLSRDHLDYHGDMESYKNEKLKLFKSPSLKSAVINIDDAVGRSIVEDLATDIQCVSYGLDKNFKPDVYGYDVELNQHGLSMKVKTTWGNGKIKSPVVGEFNASNLLAVLAVMLLNGIEFKECLQRMTKIKSVAGRMQRFGGDKSPLVIVDFAHTPDALEQVLTSLRKHTKNKLWCVFGCGGDRDKGKRALMGAVAEDKADKIVLTNDNPRSESAIDILNDINSGIKNANNLTIEQDRHAAIHFAISQAKIGDVVLVAGKGHENYQLIGDIKYPFNDAIEVQQQLEALAG